MYDMNEILALLKEGQSVEDIAASFTSALNSAIQEQEKQKNEIAARTEKIESLTNIVNSIIDFANKYYPDLIPEDMDMNFTAEDIGLLADELDETVEEMVGLMKLLNVPAHRKSKVIVKTPNKEPVTFTANNVDFGDAMKEFFKRNGL
jgi:ABC-type antimicrobial peptide transport system permease subunit